MEMNMETTMRGEVKNVHISQERYEELLEAERWLSALEASGVDNWEGYSLAEELFEEGDDK